MNRPFTRLYVDGPESLGRLVEQVRRLVGDFGSAFGERVEVEVRSSEDSEPQELAVDPTDFLRYPYSIEVEATDGCALDRYLDVVVLLMEHVHRFDGTVVAACDWEERLPGNGKLGAVFRK